MEADERVQGRICEVFRDGDSTWQLTSVSSSSMEKASEKRGPRNLCGCNHGKPQLREALGRECVGRSQVTLRALVPDSTSAGPRVPGTTAALRVGCVVWEGVGTAAIRGLMSGPGLCWTEATQAQAREGPLPVP